jgi:HAE1 family hydrophobic/amphiphilic exporter-1
VIIRPDAVSAQTPQTGQAPTPTGPVIQLTMAEAEQMALENNLALKADRLDPAIAAENLAQARAPFNPNLAASFNRSSSQSPSTSAYEGKDTITSSSLRGSTTLDHTLPWYGSSYRLSWDTSRGTSDRAANPFNPQLRSNLSLNITQPLLAGFLIDGNRAGVEAAIRNRTIADVQLDERIVITRFQAQLAYMNLIAARNRRDVAQINLDIARQQLKDNQARVEVGTMAPIDIIEGEAEVARNEEGVISAEAQIATSEDQLRQLLLDPSRPDYWQVRFEPTDMPTLTPRDVDVEAAIEVALRDRTDLVVARRNMENTDLNIRVTKNSILPQANLSFNYSASGAGGTQNQWDLTNPTNPILVNSTTRGFWTVAGDSFQNNLPTWSLGLTVSYPIGKSGTEANLARQRIARQQQETTLRAQELRVVTGVRAVGRDVQTNYRRVLVTQKARERAEAQLQAEQKKYAVGLSSTFTLQQRQRDLATARNAEVTATMDYNRSLIEFEAIQKAPVR